MTASLLTPLSYETRNIGMDCYAVTLPPTDELTMIALSDELARMASRTSVFFVQAKCTLSDFASVHLLESLGFRFAETALVPTTTIAKNPSLLKFRADPASFLPARYPVSDLSFSVMTNDAETTAVRAIAGESFTRDRFHLDPFCGEEAANRRYTNWVDDLVSDDAVTFYLLRHGDDIAGFLARRGEDLVLAGFSRRHRGSGFGDFLWLSVLKAMQEEGLRQANTQISAANTAVLNLYVRLGFKFRDPLFVLHYWAAPTAISVERI